MRIAVFMGGSSTERAVSLASGAAITEGLKTAGHDAIPFDVEWIGSRTLFTALDTVMDDGYDLVFMTLHGGMGENGGVQALLEIAGIPYTGTGPASSAIAMDKDFSKHLFARHDIPTADWIAGAVGDIDHQQVAAQVGWPCIVKPADQGSTVGLSLVNGPDELSAALESAATYADKVMVEAFLPGAELTVPVIAGETLPAIEIRPTHALYDYECKYTPGMSEYLVPAPLATALAGRIADLSLRVWNVLGLRDVARVDFRVDAGGIPRCLEANTLPGMTETSLVPKSAQAAGVDFPALVTRIAETAVSRKE